MRLLAIAAVAIVLLTACAGLRQPKTENSGLGAVTAITMARTACYGTCPNYLVRFTSDGRARYSGGDYAPLQGRFSGDFDFASLAAWIATQHPETLPDTGRTAAIDAPAVNLQIDYGARRVRITGIGEQSASLRLEGILLAIDGATARIRWRRDDPATVFLGMFRGQGVTLEVHADSAGSLFSYTTPRQCAQIRLGDAKVERGTLRLRCASRTSVLRVAGDDVQAEGNAIPPGRYVRVNPYAVSQDSLGLGRARLRE